MELYSYEQLGGQPKVIEEETGEEINTSLLDVGRVVVATVVREGGIHAKIDERTGIVIGWRVLDASENP